MSPVVTMDLDVPFKNLLANHILPQQIAKKKKERKKKEKGRTLDEVFCITMHGNSEV
jgi:hypothetical protein